MFEESNLHRPGRSAEEREDAYGDLGRVAPAQLSQIPISRLVPWQNTDGNFQPFRPYSQGKLEELAENIRKNGIIEPISVRPMAGGQFQIIAGHNRVEAAKLAGLVSVPALVQELTDEQAAILMVDSNLQHREQLLPSEKAFAYRMRLEALKQQGKRTDLTSAPMVQKLASREIVAAEAGENREQIRRYIRLTYLYLPLLDMVDDGKFPLVSAVEISYMPTSEQMLLREVLSEEKCKAPSLRKAETLRQMSKEGPVDKETIRSLLVKAPAPKIETVKLPSQRICKFFPQGTSAEAMEETIYQALLLMAGRSDQE